MSNQTQRPLRDRSWYLRLEQAVIKKLPAVITPLRFRIFLGYLSVTIIGIGAWDYLESAWFYVAAILAPVGALLGAILALKLSVVVVTVFTLLTSLIKFFSGFVVMVLKPGILKAILMPPLISLLKWIHQKSTRLQNWVHSIYERGKTVSATILRWWQQQHVLDKTLLFGFLIPLLVIVVVIFIIQRTTAVFAVKKLSEQIVQRTTKFFIRNFHRIPLIGSLPVFVTNKARQWTRLEDREDVIFDFKNLGREIFEKTTGKKERVNTDHVNQANAGNNTNQND